MTGNYYIDYWLDDKERLDSNGEERYVIAIRDSRRPPGWVFRFAHFDTYVQRVLRNLNYYMEAAQ